MPPPNPLLRFARRRRSVRSPLPRLLLAYAVFGGSVAPVLATAAAAAPGTATDEVEVLAEADDDADILLLLPSDAAIEIDGKAENGYYPVVIGELDGWVPTGGVASVVDDDRDDRDERNDPTVVVVAAADVALRAEPDNAADRLLGIEAGEAVEPTGEQDAGFVEVRFADESGWVRGASLTIDPGGAADGAAPPDDDRAAPRAERAQPDKRAQPDERAAKPERVPRAERVGRAAREVKQRADRADRRRIPQPPRNAPNYARGELIRIIEEAADYYDQPREDMLRVARCESELTPTAVNPRTGDSGLFQFNPDTWQTTPYRRYSIFDPRASAFAAGWMWSVGRRNEWVCQ